MGPMYKIRSVLSHELSVQRGSYARRDVVNTHLAHPSLLGKLLRDPRTPVVQDLLRARQTNVVIPIRVLPIILDLHLVVRGGLKLLLLPSVFPQERAHMNRTVEGNRNVSARANRAKPTRQMEHIPKADRVTTTTTTTTPILLPPPSPRPHARPAVHQAKKTDAVGGGGGWRCEWAHSSKVG